MSRIRLRSPDQPWLVRLLLGTYEFCASLKLAVFLILSAAFVLGLATFVESRMGLRAVHFGIYGTWWFSLLNALLAVNIFCAAAIRFPWKRYQTGFVITHIGLLTLLAGCFMSRVSGIDAQMPIWEDGTNHVAAEDEQHFLVSVHPHTSDDVEKADDGRQVESVRVPFAAGPFNWDDLEGNVWMAPWWLAHRDKGVVYDRDGVKLEVLDFYSDSAVVDVPRVTLELAMPSMTRTDEETGRQVKMPESLTKVQLTAEKSNIALPGEQRRDRMQLGGGAITFSATNNADETQAFLNSSPEGELGKSGQVVLYVNGEVHRFSVADHVGGDAVPLGDSGLEVSVKEAYADEPTHFGTITAVVLTIRKAGAETTDGDKKGDDTGAEEIWLFADHPESNRQARNFDVYGTYWFDHGKIETADLMAGRGTSRFDILEGADHTLYYRYWNRQQVAAIGELPEDGKRVDAFTMPMGTIQLFVEEHLASNASGVHVEPLPFNKDMTSVNANRAARIRLTVDGNSKEMWLTGPPVTFGLGGRQPLEMQSVEGKGRTATVMMPLDPVDVGFNIKLLKFTRKLDPGTEQAADFASNVDFIDPEGDTLARDVLITMNAPVDFSDPQRGRSYRLFQEAYQGPFDPESPQYRLHYMHTAVPEANRRQRIYISILTVNYDPGRWVKYAGCYLIVAGILTMFYMRAYFFKPSAERRAAATG